TVLLWSLFFFSSRRRHTRFSRDWSSDVCSSDLAARPAPGARRRRRWRRAPAARRPPPGRSAVRGSSRSVLLDVFGQGAQRGEDATVLVGIRAQLEAVALADGQRQL